MATTDGWNSRGYPKLATLMSRKPETAVFRHFKSLQLLALLKYQARLQDLEYLYKLACADDNAVSDSNRATLTSDFYQVREAAGEQCRLLEEITSQIRDYNQPLLEFKQTSSLQKPVHRQRVFLREWLRGKLEGDDFLCGGERDIWDEINDRDLVVVCDRANNDLSLDNYFLETVARLYHWCWGSRRTEQPDEEIGRVSDFRESRSRHIFQLLAETALSTAATMLPVMAILALYHIETDIQRIWASIGFTGAFGLALRLFTNAKQHEIFIAPATFAAVEVVFIGNN